MLSIFEPKVGLTSCYSAIKSFTENFSSTKYFSEKFYPWDMFLEFPKLDIDFFRALGQMGAEV